MIILSTCLRLCCIKSCILIPVNSPVYSPAMLGITAPMLTLICGHLVQGDGSKEQLNSIYILFQVLLLQIRATQLSAVRKRKLATSPTS